MPSPKLARGLNYWDDNQIAATMKMIKKIKLNVSVAIIARTIITIKASIDFIMIPNRSSLSASINANTANIIIITIAPPVTLGITTSKSGPKLFSIEIPPFFNSKKWLSTIINKYIITEIYIKVKNINKGKEDKQ